MYRRQVLRIVRRGEVADAYVTAHAMGVLELECEMCYR